MSALEIAVGVTSAFFFCVILRRYLMRLSISGPTIPYWIAATVGTVWFAARLWGFA